LDPTRLFTARIKKAEEFKLEFTESEQNKDTPFEVHFTKGSDVQFFDVDTLKRETQNVKPDSVLDSLRQFYYSRLFSRDFGYITKGLS